MERIEVTASLPLREYQLIAAIADRRGVRAHVVLEGIAHKALAAQLEAAEQRRFQNKIARLNAEGLNDSEIARRLGVNSERVRDNRNRLGLPRNDPRGRTKSTQPKGQIA